MNYHPDLGATSGDEGAGFEHRAVERLLGFYHLTKVKQALLRKEFADRGQLRLTFLQFLDMFPDFPVGLAFHWERSSSKTMREISITGLLLRFPRTRLAKFYDNIHEDSPAGFEGRSVGLVFNWPHVTEGLVLHEEFAEPTIAGQFVWRDEESQRVFCIERFHQFLTRLAWEPSYDE